MSAPAIGLVCIALYPEPLFGYGPGGLLGYFRSTIALRSRAHIA